MTDKCSQLLNQLTKDHEEPNAIEPIEQQRPTDQPETIEQQRTDLDQVTNHTHRSGTRTSRSGRSILMKQRAKLEAANAKLEFAAREVEIQREKVELEARLTMLTAEKEAAVARRELDAMYDEMDQGSGQSVQFSKQEVPIGITQDRVHSFVKEQNAQFNNSICAEQLPRTEEHLPLNPSANSFRPDHAKLEDPVQSQEIAQPHNEHVWNQGQSNYHSSPFQGFSEFLMRKELLSSRLIKFDDKPESFLSWKATFCSIMDEMKVSAAEETDLLIKWLGPQSGKHATSIRNASTDNYARGLSLIWKRLAERYGSPELIEASLKKKLANFTKITYREKGKLYELADILMEIQSCKANPRYEKLLGHFDTAAGINPIVIKLPQNLQNKWRDRATNFKMKHDVAFPPFDYFVSYINDMSKIMNDPGFDFEADSYTKSQQPQGKPVKTTVTVRKTDTQRVSSELVDQCPIHKSRHSLNKCKAFRAKPIKERKDFLFTNGLCFRCCGSEKHLAKNCTVSVLCEICQGTNHPSALHVNGASTNKSSQGKPSSESTRAHGGELEFGDKTTKVNTSFCTQVCGDPTITSKSCGKIVLARIYPEGRPQEALNIYTIIDDQSNRTLGRSSLLDHFNERGPSIEYAMMSCTGTHVTTGRRASGFIIESMDRSFRTHLPGIIECNNIPDVREEIPSPEVVEHFRHLQDLKDVIPPIDESASISLLIGRDLPEVHHILDQRTGKPGLPFAQRLQLGWVIIGETCLGSIHQTDFVNVNKICTLPNGRPTSLNPCLNNIDVKVKEDDIIFQKTPDDNKRDLSIQDKEFLEIMDSKLHKDNEGNWVAPLPFRSPRTKLPNNREMALKRAKSLENSMKRSSKKRQDMFDFMKKILEKGHAEVAPDILEHQERWYLPLFGVYHPRKPDKIRGVFVSSAKFEGASLNSILLNSPDLTNSLLGVLLRFRKERVAITADIEHMFYCFVVEEDHRDLLRFFWYKDNNMDNPLIEFRMTRHVFGNGPSPAVATYALRKTVEGAECEVRDFINRNFYVDDGLLSVSDSATAIDILRRTQQTLKQEGNLRLHKIASNNKDVLQAFDKEDLSKDIKNLDLCKDDLPVQSSLGLIWDINTDAFTFCVSSDIKPYTKRGVLSTINSLFDPLGIVAPVSIKGRLLLRSCISSPHDWDDPLPVELQSDWKEWRDSLAHLETLSIPRACKSDRDWDVVSRELHTFCDASKDAIGAVSYMRTCRKDESEDVYFILGKAKVAPQKGHTIPRLELCAAVLGTEVAQTALEHLDMEFDRIYYYTDSRIVLGYISNEERRFYVYVSNRVDRIRSASDPAQWRHVSTALNPADLATRSVHAKDIQTSIWLQGPDLSQIETKIDIFPLVTADIDKEVRPEIVVSKTAVMADTRLGADRFLRFSSWDKLVRGMAFLKRSLRFRRKVYKSRSAEDTLEMLMDSVKDAEREIIRAVQQDVCCKEIQCLKQGKRLPQDSNLLPLSPVLDSHAIIRVGGRLNKVQPTSLETNPIVIPKGHHVATLLIRHCHEKVKHQGRHFTEGAVRANGYWIIGGKRQISAVLRQCVTCRKLRGILASQKMSDLPTDRCEVSPPFTFVGIDTFGPWSVNSRRTRGGQANSKRWAILFTCMATRAIHIELVEELSTSSFINALRFMALRGPVKQFRSDRGTNFVGAVHELDIQEVVTEEANVKDFLLQNQVTWMFNPPHASHMGGAWERMIGLSRKILDSMLLGVDGKNLTHEILATFLAEVCAIVNLRPLVPVSSDPEAPEVLTPNVLLTQKTEPCSR